APARPAARQGGSAGLPAGAGAGDRRAPRPRPGRRAAPPQPPPHSWMSFGAKFLRRPDRFPERAEGEPWGRREMALELPGGPHRLTGLSAAQEEGVRATFPAGAAPAPAAVADPSDRGIVIQLFHRAAADFLPVDARGWEYGLDFGWSPSSVRLA